MEKSKDRRGCLKVRGTFCELQRGRSDRKTYSRSDRILASLVLPSNRSFQRKITVEVFFAFIRPSEASETKAQLSTALSWATSLRGVYSTQQVARDCDCALGDGPQSMGIDSLQVAIGSVAAPPPPVDVTAIMTQPLCHLPLTPAHCRARLQWCLARSDWNHADFGRIVFSEESRFQLCPDDNQKHAQDRSCFPYCTPHRPSTSTLALFFSKIMSNHICPQWEGGLHLPGNVDDLAQQLEEIWQEIPQGALSLYATTYGSLHPG
ncbi:hypothetical protein TNCV_683171 [Trichonephila clavipes]|nr:hypothetical protein TNCV_683171 [Trichonephila clavipes]